MEISDRAYQALADRLAPKSRCPQNCAKAFLIGGLICALGQGIKLLWRSAGLSEDGAGLMSSVSLIFLSVLLTGFAVYDDIARHAGAGTLVPITGFANAVAAPAIEYKTEGLVTGLAVKMFSIAGPVLVFGISASVVYGLIFWTVQLF